MNKFKIGDIVKISPTSKYYDEGESNPAETAGEVFLLDNPGELNYKVKWNNGKTNSYSEKDLIYWTEQSKESKRIEDILKEAKRRFKPGCRYKDTEGFDQHSSAEDSPYIFNVDPIQIVMSVACGLIYDGKKGKWGEVISEPNTPSEGDKLIKEAMSRYTLGSIFFSVITGDECEVRYIYSYDHTSDTLLDDGYAVYRKGEWADKMPSSSKFAIGDRVIGNDMAGKIYKDTGEGWVGYVTRIIDGTGEIEVKANKNKHGQVYWVDPECFDHYPESKESIINSQIKTSENGNKEQQHEGDSGSVIKVPRIDIQVSRGSIARGTGLNSTGSEIAIGNRHRNHEARSIRG